MEKAKQYAQELSESGSCNEPKDLTNLKVDINNMLHCYLPHDVTVGQSEVLAMVIFDIISDPNRYLKP